MSREGSRSMRRADAPVTPSESMGAMHNDMFSSTRSRRARTLPQDCTATHAHPLDLANISV